ncbi:MAG: hypothetical protein JRE71_05070, partial [Deltaproteobacteria bacterium]|nr:hypothetical protein [Deltaproteobacteria bacterium]
NPICNGGAGGPGGNGDESCGIHFKIAVTGDLSILSYSPILGISEYNNTGSELDASLVTTDPLDILQIGPTKIGTLVLDVSGAQGGLGSVTLLRSVDADLELVGGNGRDVFFVPEPAVVLQLVVGALGLAVLDRRRAVRE